jgi:repressor LexA
MTLTPRQREVLDFIRSFSTEKGYAPSRTDVCKAMGVSSTNAAQEILTRLVKAGAIEIAPNIARGIKIL